MTINFGTVMVEIANIGVSQAEMDNLIQSDNKSNLKKCAIDREKTAEKFLSLWSEIIKYGSSSNAGGPEILADKFMIHPYDAMLWCKLSDYYLMLKKANGDLD